MKNFFLSMVGQVATQPATTQPVNLLTAPRDLMNDAWEKNNASIWSNSTTSADGTTSADKLVVAVTADAQPHAIKQVISKPATSLGYVFSLEAKASEITNMVIDVANSDGGSGTYMVLNNGAVTGSGAWGSGYSLGTPVITQLANGFYKISATLTSNNSENISVLIRPLNEATAVSFIGNGTDGIYLDNITLSLT